TALGIVGFVMAVVGKHNGLIGIVVAVSQVVVVIWAVTVGSFLPMVFRRMGLDPAVMSAPFITTLVDATGLIFYFTIARIILTELH
ncbi:MAG: magnesium transporter, partial [Proteobacteria bacterium]